MILTRKYETAQIHLFLLLFWHWPGTFFFKTNWERERTTRKVIGLNNAIKGRFNYVTKATVTLELKAFFKRAKTELAFSKYHYSLFQEYLLRGWQWWTFAFLHWFSGQRGTSCARACLCASSILLERRLQWWLIASKFLSKSQPIF